MLILSRKLGESIVIDGRITVKVVRVDGDVIKLGIAAPLDVPVHRQEVYEEIRQSNVAALQQRTDIVPRLSTRPAVSRSVPSPDRSLPDGLASHRERPNQKPSSVKASHVPLNQVNANHV
jgi:carbon storage regulator